MNIDNVNFEWLDQEARLEAATQPESVILNLSLSDAHRVLLSSATTLEVAARNQLLSRLHLGGSGAWRAIQRLPDWFFQTSDPTDLRIFDLMNFHWGNRRIDSTHRMRYWAWHGWMRGIQECYPYVAQIVDARGVLENLPDMWYTRVPRKSERPRESFRVTHDFTMEQGGRVFYIPGVGAVPTVQDFPMDWSGTSALLRFRPGSKFALRLKLALWNDGKPADFRQANYADPVFSSITDMANYFNIRSTPPSLIQTGFGELDSILVELHATANEQYWRKIIEFLTDALGVDDAMQLIQKGGS